MSRRVDDRKKGRGRKNEKTAWSSNEKNSRREETEEKVAGVFALFMLLCDADAELRSMARALSREQRNCRTTLQKDDVVQR